MASVMALTFQHFVIIGSKNKALGVNIPGNVLVLFKMQRCDNCAQFEPIFLSLPKVENRIAFAIMDITNNPLVNLSRTTSTPINTVPMLILYINGKPHSKFGGTKNIPSIQNFITKALQLSSGPPPSSMVQPPQQFMAPPSNMYGPSGYQTGPQQNGLQNGLQQNAFPQQGKSWMPEIGTAPSMKGVIKGGYSGGGHRIEEEEDPRLSIPDTVIPYNSPWEIDMNGPS